MHVLKGGTSHMVKSLLNRSGVLSILVLAQSLTLTPALAVPSNKETWSNEDYGIHVYADAEDSDIYWFIPKIRFETKDGKTLLRAKTLANGRREYTVRIIPYFSNDLKRMAAQNISNIRQDSQLKPVIAKTIGMTLPDFDYRFTSVEVTNFQYLNTPRLLKFSLSKEEAATFDELYQDENGINVDFSIAYDAMMTDKFYKLSVSCKDMTSVLDAGMGVGSDGKGSGASVDVNAGKARVFVGAELEAAFLRTITNSTKGVDIVSKGDIPGMQEMLRNVLNLCFVPVQAGNGWDNGGWDNGGWNNDPQGNDNRVPTRRPTNTNGRNRDDTREDTRNDRNPDPKSTSPRSNLLNSIKNSVSMISSGASYVTASERANLEMQAIHDSLSLDKSLTDSEDPGTEDGAGLLPSAALKMNFRLKKTTTSSSNQAIAKQVSLRDATNVTVIAGILSAVQKSVEQVTVKSLIEKKVLVSAKNPMYAPLKTGVQIQSGQQWTLNAAFIFKARSSYSSTEKQYVWDAKWDKPDGDLYFRIGNGSWTPVNGRTIIESGVIGEGELQLYVDRSAIFNKIDEKLRTGGVFTSPVFTESTISPQFLVEISGRTIVVR